MSSNDQIATIEGFVTDFSFVDQTKGINGIFTNEGGKVASLTPRALSYLSTPSIFVDKRDPSTRAVSWTAQRAPALVIDEDAFSTFVDTVNKLPTGSGTVGFFKIIDKLLFNHVASDSHSSIEAALLADADIKTIYVPGTFSTSSVLVSDTVYPLGGGTHAVSVPSYANFQVKLTSGSTSITFIMKLYVSVDAWLEGYNVSTVVKVIPALPYDKLLNASLLNSTDNIFATASTSALLAYTQTQMSLGQVSVSGISEYKAILTDGTNNTTVPFNILYKGRPPTLFEIRNAIKAELLSSGVGDATSWKARIPSVFVSGRFYVVPLWDLTYQKPDQLLFPNIATYSSLGNKTNQILSSLGYGDVASYTDVFPIYFNRMTATAIPDLSGAVDVHHLIELVPDYQSYSPTDAQFAYMLNNTQLFARELNEIMAVDSGAKASTVYTPDKEGLLSFYSFTVGDYEICVITKVCYNTIVESTQ